MGREGMGRERRKGRVEMRRWRKGSGVPERREEEEREDRGEDA